MNSGLFHEETRTGYDAYHATYRKVQSECNVHIYAYVYIFFGLAAMQNLRNLIESKETLFKRKN